MMLMMMRCFALCIVFLLGFGAHAAESEDKIRYVPVSIANVSDLLFKKEILRAEDPAAVEEYIRIHHCGLYEQYGSDDFAWSRIREAQARDLKLRHMDFPEGLEIASAIRMDQYDLNKNEFRLHSESQMNNTGYITALKQEGGSFSPCKDEKSASFVPRVHPLDLIVKLDKPFTLTGIPMAHATADHLIGVINKRDELIESIKRGATLVLRMRIIGIDPLSSVTDPLRRTVLGEITSVRVYDGPERKVLLYKKEF